MFDSGASDERECIQIEPKSRHGETRPEPISAWLTFTEVSPNRLSPIGFDMFERIFEPPKKFVALPSFIEPSAVGFTAVVSVVQLSLPCSLSPPLPKPGSVYQPNSSASGSLELSPSRSPCQMHIPTTTPCELLPSKVISRSPSDRIGTSETPLSKVPGMAFSSNDTFALPEPSRRSNAP